MASFEELEQLFGKFPVWKCPECGERKREQFMLFMQIPVEVPIEEFDHLEKTIFAAWRESTWDHEDYADLQVWCAGCEKVYPLPEGWKLVMR